MVDTEENATDVVLVEDRGNGIRVVVLNRPHTLNAFNDALHHRLPEVLVELDGDPSVRVVVLTGAGRAFSSGGDRNRNGGEPDFEQQRLTFRLGRRLMDSLLALHVPVIAAVNGPAIGLGATLVTSADLVVMADTAFLADTHVAVGLVAGDGGALSWPSLVGLTRAKEYLFTGDRLHADKALEFGIANRVVPADELMSEALALAERLAALPGQPLQETKMLLNLQLRQAAASVLGFGLATEQLSKFASDAPSASDQRGSRPRD